jgi:TonB family protein
MTRCKLNGTRMSFRASLPEKGSNMKTVYLVAAAFALSSQMTMAWASAAQTLSAQIVPLSPSHVAAAGVPGGCNVLAAIAGTPYFEVPEIAAQQGATGTAQIKIDLTSDGNLTGAALYASSGNRWLDRAAIKSARMTQFTPEISNCRRVSGSYLYEVRF